MNYSNCQSHVEYVIINEERRVYFIIIIAYCFTLGSGGIAMYYFLSLLCGILVAVTVAQNGGLADKYGVHTSSVIIHLTGLLVIGIIMLIKRERPFNKRQVWYLYLGGAIGVLTVACNNLAFGRISVSAILAIILLGQSVMGLAFDQYGWLGMQKHPFNKRRIIGLLLTIGGIVVMTDRFDYIAVSLSFLAGIIIVISRSLNARLAELTSIRVSTFFNYTIGLIVSIVVLIIFGRNEPLKTDIVISSDFYIYFGGTFGVCLVLISNIVVTKIPAFYLTLLSFVGQVFTGIIIDTLIDRSFSILIMIGGMLVAAGLCVDIIISRNIAKEAT